MNLSRTRQLLAFVLSCTLLSPVAAESDFEFTVPVNLTNLPPEVERVSVCCRVTQGARALSNGICSSSQAVSGSSYSGEFRINVDLFPREDPASAEGYYCYALLQANVEGSTLRLSPVSRDGSIPLESGSLRVSDNL